MQLVEQDVFRRIQIERVHGSSIIRVASQYVYVDIDENIEAIADSFSRHIEVLAVGVVDAHNKLMGVIERGELFHRLGKPFGRDILSRKTACEVVETTELFYYDDNVFNIAEQVGHHAGNRERIRYFGLVDADGGFAGLFSSIDILAYLSFISQQDITLAGQLQERLLSPVEQHEYSGCTFLSFSQFAKGMGGDFTYVHDFGDGRHFFTLCDVSGKGAAASIITSMLWGMLRVYDWSRGLVQLIKDVNLAIIQAFHLEKYLTGVFAVYNEQTRELVLADMGHSHSYVLRGARVKHIDVDRKNLPVGIELSLEPTVLRIRLRPGDILTVVTDGLLEQENPAGECREIDEWLAPVAAADFADSCTVLREEFHRFRQEVVQLDDLSALFMQIHDQDAPDATGLNKTGG